jgi:hypothetical protein
VSLRSTVAAVVDRHAAPQPRSPLRETPGGGAAPSSTAGDVIARLVRYLPTELVASSVCAGFYDAEYVVRMPRHASRQRRTDG